MRHFVLLLTLGVVSTTAVHAAEDPRMAQLHGNTAIVHTQPEGWVFKVYFNGDDTFSQVGPTGYVEGRNWFEGDNLCNTPTGSDKKFCHYFGHSKPGDRWVDKESRNGVERQIDFVLLKGRQ